jgi:MoaA/NifB/PqqE/SkfB family radical SAM enzyme
VRGVKTAWDRVTATLKELAPRTDELNITLAVNQTVVDEEGVDHYSKLREYLKPMGIQHNLVMAYDVSATYSTEREITLTPGDLGSFSTFGDFTGERVLKLMNEVERDIRDFPLADRMAKRYYLEGIRNRILEGKADPNPACVALGSHMRLLPDGTVPVCQFNSRIIGDLKKEGFKDVWRGEEAERQRRWVRNCPGCWAECEVLPNGLYSGDIFARLFRRSS